MYFNSPATMKHCFEQFAVVKIFTELPSKQLPVLSKKKKILQKGVKYAQS